MWQKNGFYTTASDDQLSNWTEKKLQKTSQSQTCTKKKVMVIVWWSAARLIHYSFLKPGETITSEKCSQQIDEMHWKMQHFQPALVHERVHNNVRPHIAQPTFQKLNELGYEVLPHLPHSPDLSRQQTTNSSGIATTFCRENAFTTSRMQKTLSRSLLKLEAQIFMPQEYTNLFLK